MRRRKTRRNSRRNKCHTGMVRYRDQQEAKMAISSIRSAEDNRDRKPTRAFSCPQCHGWHLAAS